jgi:hypothetical protein
LGDCPFASLQTVIEYKNEKEINKIIKNLNRGRILFLMKKIKIEYLKRDNNLGNRKFILFLLYIKKIKGFQKKEQIFRNKRRM